MAAVTGPFMMTYDQDSRVEAMAQERGFAITRVAMNNTHHRQMVELLISQPAAAGYLKHEEIELGTRLAVWWKPEG